MKIDLPVIDFGSRVNYLTNGKFISGVSLSIQTLPVRRFTNTSNCFQRAPNSSYVLKVIQRFLSDVDIYQINYFRVRILYLLFNGKVLHYEQNEKCIWSGYFGRWAEAQDVNDKQCKQQLQWTVNLVNWRHNWWHAQLFYTLKSHLCDHWPYLYTSLLGRPLDIKDINGTTYIVVCESSRSLLELFTRCEQLLWNSLAKNLHYSLLEEFIEDIENAIINNRD